MGVIFIGCFLARSYRSAIVPVALTIA